MTERERVIAKYVRLRFKCRCCGWWNRLVGGIQEKARKLAEQSKASERTR